MRITKRERLMFLGRAALLLLSSVPSAVLAGCAEQPAASTSQTTSSANAIATAAAVPASAKRPPRQQPIPRMRRTRSEPGTVGRYRGKGEDNRDYQLMVATRGAPLKYRRAVAYATLAAHLGCGDAVARTQLWHLSLPDLQQLLGKPFADLAPHLSIDHSASVAVLFTSTPAGKRISNATGEVDRIRRLAASEAPIPPADVQQQRSWTCINIADFLSAHVVRQHWHLSDAGALRGVANERAFRGYLPGGAHQQLLTRLAEMRRFPKSLYTALTPAAAAQLFASMNTGPFVDTALGPRQRSDMRDRMATVRSLIHARIQQQGETQTLSL